MFRPDGMGDNGTGRAGTRRVEIFVGREAKEFPSRLAIHLIKQSPKKYRLFSLPTLSGSLHGLVKTGVCQDRKRIFF